MDRGAVRIPVDLTETRINHRAAKYRKMLENLPGNILKGHGRPLDLVLVPDPNVDDQDCFGSYLVFRKLEQNVKGFQTAAQELARSLDLPEWDRERAGAMAVGRFRDGTPVTLSQKDRMDLAWANTLPMLMTRRGCRARFMPTSVK